MESKGCRTGLRTLRKWPMRRRVRPVRLNGRPNWQVTGCAKPHSAAKGEGVSTTGAPLQESPAGKELAVRFGYEVTKRICDAVFSVLTLVVLSPPLLMIAMVIKLNSRGPAVLAQLRAGRNDRLFHCYKFRTMVTDTPEVATDKLENPEQYVTKVGYYLRKYSLDELPQLFNILRGEMSFVGPRPALHNQYDLRAMRNRAGVSRLRPGLTGWAQVNGRDDIPLIQKVGLDTDYARHRSLWFDIRILYRTVSSVASGNGVQATAVGPRQVPGARGD
ncbi:MAG: sugar transferase [Acidobacteriaceae bacterium]